MTTHFGPFFAPNSVLSQRSDLKLTLFHPFIVLMKRVTFDLPYIRLLHTPFVGQSKKFSDSVHS